MRFLPYLALLSALLSGAQAECIDDYEAPTWPFDRKEPIHALPYLCKAKLSGTYRKNDRKEACVELKNSVPHVKIYAYFTILYEGPNIDETMAEKDCVEALAREIGGCEHGGVSDALNGFRVAARPHYNECEGMLSTDYEGRRR